MAAPKCVGSVGWIASVQLRTTWMEGITIIVYNIIIFIAKKEYGLMHAPVLKKALHVDIGYFR